MTSCYIPSPRRQLGSHLIVESEEVDISQELLQAPAPTAKEPGQQAGAEHHIHRVSAATVPLIWQSILALPPKTPSAYSLSGAHLRVFWSSALRGQTSRPCSNSQGIKTESYSWAAVAHSELLNGATNMAGHPRFGTLHSICVLSLWCTLLGVLEISSQSANVQPLLPQPRI